MSVQHSDLDDDHDFSILPLLLDPPHIRLHSLLQTARSNVRHYSGRPHLPRRRHSRRRFAHIGGNVRESPGRRKTGTLDGSCRGGTIGKCRGDARTRVGGEGARVAPRVSARTHSECVPAGVLAQESHSRILWIVDCRIRYAATETGPLHHHVGWFVVAAFPLRHGRIGISPGHGRVGCTAQQECESRGSDSTSQDGAVRSHG